MSPLYFSYELEHLIILFRLGNLNNLIFKKHPLFQEQSDLGLLTEILLSELVLNFKDLADKLPYFPYSFDYLLAYQTPSKKPLDADIRKHYIVIMLVNQLINLLRNTLVILVLLLLVRS